MSFFAATSSGEGLPWPFLIIYIAGLFGIVYFLLLRPQRKKEKDRLAMLQNIKKNDRVITTGGIYGIVSSVGKNEITLKVDESNNTKIRVTVSAISGIIRPEDKKDETGP